VFKTHYIIRGSSYCQLKDDVNIIYQRTTGDSNKFIDDNLKYIAVEYIMNSFEKLTTQEKDLIALKYKKFERIFKANYFNSMISIIRIELTNNDIDMIPAKHHIHFNNGYVNLKTGKFYKRKFGKHFITYDNTTGYDYKKPTEKNKKKVMEIYKQIYKEEDALSYALNYYGSCLSGDSTKDQKILVNIGQGSSGKSTMLNSLKHALSENYFIQFDKEALSKNNHKRDKILNSLGTKAIRIIYINEIETKTLDKDLMKQLADGDGQTTKLYTDGSYTIDLQGSLIIN